MTSANAGQREEGQNAEPDLRAQPRPRSRAEHRGAPRLRPVRRPWSCPGRRFASCQSTVCSRQKLGEEVGGSAVSHRSKPKEKYQGISRVFWDEQFSFPGHPPRKQVIRRWSYSASSRTRHREGGEASAIADGFQPTADKGLV